MTVVKPFKGIRPKAELVDKIAALPYDVYNRKEAREIVQNNPLTFLQIDRGETLLPETVDIYDQQVYDACSNRFQEMLKAGEFVQDEELAYYVYELERNGKSQKGIVGLVQAKDYENGTIKKHENTREVKENDRIRHIDALKAHTGPIFLTYKNDKSKSDYFADIMEETEVIFEFIADDGIRHKGYKVNTDKGVQMVEKMMGTVDGMYIADGHHRAASAAKIAKKYNYEGECADFLAVMFPDDELVILDYNRVLKDLNGMSEEAFISRIEEDFTVVKSDVPVSPSKKADFGMYLGGQWYTLIFKKPEEVAGKPIDSLDVAILQDYLLDPVLDIKDPRTSERIDFVGGIRGLKELEKRCSEDMVVAFSLKPTSISELISVSDADMLMPPKSTWFEPKLRSGLFIHQI